MAHDNPVMFARLAGVLAGCGRVVAHIDAKVDEGEFRRRVPGSVDFVGARVDVTWGTFSMVEATISACRRALDDPAVGRVTIVSGVSYPLVSDRTLAADWGNGEWIAVHAAPDVGRGKGPERFAYRYVGFRNPTGLPARLANGAVRRLARPIDHREVLGDLQLAAGSQWWSLTRPTLDAVLRVHDANDVITRYFRRTLLPDESYFQTLVGAFAEPGTLRGETTFVRWDGGPHPGLLSPAALDEAIDAGAFLFARKITDGESELADHLDERRQENHPSSSR